MTATHSAFYLYRGDTWRIDATLHDNAGAALNLTDAEIEWFLWDSAGTEKAHLQISAGVEVVNAAAGTCRVTYPAADSANLAVGNYTDSIVVTTSDDIICTQSVGQIIVNSGAKSQQITTDPCAILAALEQARVDILTGRQIVRLRVENVERQFTASSMSDLNAAISQYQVKCNRALGLTPNRYAIR